MDESGFLFDAAGDGTTNLPHARRTLNHYTTRPRYDPEDILHSMHRTVACSVAAGTWTRSMGVFICCWMQSENYSAAPQASCRMRSKPELHTIYMYMDVSC